MEFITGLTRSQNCSTVEDGVIKYEENKKKYVISENYDKNDIFTYNMFYMNHFTDDSLFIKKKTVYEHSKMLIFKVDNIYMEYIVNKLNTQEVPKVIQISYDEYNQLEDILELKDDIYTSIKKYDVIHWAIGDQPKYYFKIIGKYTIHENPQKIKISWLSCTNNHMESLKYIKAEDFGNV